MSTNIIDLQKRVIGKIASFSCERNGFKMMKHQKAENVSPPLPGRSCGGKNSAFKAISDLLTQSSCFKQASCPVHP